PFISGISKSITATRTSCSSSSVWPGRGPSAVQTRKPRSWRNSASVCSQTRSSSISRISGAVIMASLVSRRLQDPTPPAPPPEGGGGARRVFLPLAASGRGPGGGVLQPPLNSASLRLHGNLPRSGGLDLGQVDDEDAVLALGGDLGVVDRLVD